MGIDARVSPTEQNPEKQRTVLCEYALGRGFVIQDERTSISTPARETAAAPSRRGSLADISRPLVPLALRRH